jgi:hypothetical protein
MVHIVSAVHYVLYFSEISQITGRSLSSALVNLELLLNSNQICIIELRLHIF